MADTPEEGLFDALDPSEPPEVFGVSLLTNPLSSPLRGDRPLTVSVREVRLLTETPWARSLGRFDVDIRTEGWKFPQPSAEPTPAKAGDVAEPKPEAETIAQGVPPPPADMRPVRPKPTAETVMLKDRLLYLLQPPLQGVFGRQQVEVPFQPFPYQLEGIAFLMPRHAALLADEMGLGKAQPLDASVLTPTGWQRMGELRVGDAVCNSAGGASRVIGVYPQGEREVFRVEFSDGAATECCDEHLWFVNTPGQAGRVLPLSTIRGSLRTENGRCRYFVPLPEPVRFEDFATREVFGERGGVSPSGSSECRFTTPPMEKNRRGSRPPARQNIRFASIDARRSLLNRLLTSNGTAFSTTSHPLADDVRFIVQSLGGTARLTSRRGQHHLDIALPGNGCTPRRAIVCVTSVGRKPVQCIAVDAPDHLYITDDCVLTHNTAQAILSLRLLFHQGLIHRALVVCPKPLVNNWSRELASWAPDVPFEVLGGDTASRKSAWSVSNTPLKLVNYELLTRDAEFVDDDRVKFDVVVCDEAQRIKNHDSKTAQVVRCLRRSRSWAITGTPVENRPEDLVNLFAFIDPGRIPPDTPAKRLPALTADAILRRTKDLVASDMPPRIIQDVHLDLSPAQRSAYTLAETEGVVRLNAMGDTITVQHVFELCMRLKQICNFDPATGSSAKLDQLVADMQEVAESGRKAIVFSQWVEPLEVLAKALAPMGPLQFHGKVPTNERQRVLDQFKSDPTKHVILMSYGTGSVGLNLQFTNYVFLFDRWWNPAVEDQAINRAHRLGQKSTVFVKRFISTETIEGKIAAVLEKKRELFQELVAQNGPPPKLGMKEEEIFGLFDIRSRPRRVA